MRTVSRVEVSWVSPRGRPVTETEPSVPRATTMRQSSDDPTAPTVKGSDTVPVVSGTFAVTTSLVMSGAVWFAPMPSEITVISPVALDQRAM